MEKAVVPDVVKSQECVKAENSGAERSSEVFLGSEIMPAVTIRIPMPQGAAVPAQIASQTPIEPALRAAPPATPDTVPARGE